MTSYRIVLKDPVTAQVRESMIWAEAAEEAMLVAGTGFASELSPSSGESELERIADRLDLLALHPAEADFRKGWHPTAARELCDRGLAAFVKDTVPVISTADSLVEGVTDTGRPLLIIVHPGSLEGSYAMDYRDQFDGDEAPEHMTDPALIREGTAREVLGFEGDLAAVLGDFCDEIEYGYRFGPPTLADALERIGREGLLLLAEPEDTELSRAADLIVARLRAAERPFVLLSGAWADAGNGCLDTVAHRLSELGCTVRISEHAAWSVHAPRFPVGRPDEGEAATFGR
jgi:hypothetical protein